MLHRNIVVKIRHELLGYPIIALTGPRQSGKTRLLRTHFPEYTYLSLEDPDLKEFATRDTKGFLQKYNDKIIFDEVQNVPVLFSYLQGIVDLNHVMGQFILSGSQNFQLLENITQSLAGRVSIFRLFPPDISEMKAAHWMPDNLPEVITKGFYPAIYDRNLNPDRYYFNYLTTYIKRDISQLINIQNDRLFNTFLKLCARRAGNILNLSELAKDASISHTTARSWISLLETSFIIYLLPPYYNNYNKRLIKSPKLYFYDTGLLSYLSGIRNGDISPISPIWGQLFENMVVSDLVKQNYHHNTLKEFYYWRDSHGHEIDLLSEENDQLKTYEIKASTTLRSNMFEGLEYFRKISGVHDLSQNLIYGGPESQTRNDSQVIPWRDIS